MNYAVSLLKEIITKRKLIWDLGKADFRKRFVGSYFGIVWMFIQPIVTVVIYAVIFGIGFKSPPPVPGVSYVAWLVPGSWMVDAQIREEGLDKILEEAGFAIRQPGCSACLAMNDDKVPAGKYAVSTSNRNFEGRQGPGSRTLLASPLVAAAAAVTGVITDPRTLI